jgi:hypothetical protein
MVLAINSLRQDNTLDKRGKRCPEKVMRAFKSLGLQEVDVGNIRNHSWNSLLGQEKRKRSSAMAAC